MATHSIILSWRIPWTEEPGRLQFMGSQRVGHDWVTEHTHTQTDIWKWKKWKWKLLSHIRHMEVKKVKMKIAQSHLTLCDPMDCILTCNPSGQNTGVGNLSLLQEIFPNQGSNPGLPHGRQILYQLSHKGSPRVLEWVAYPFSSGSSQPRNRTSVSCIAGGFFTNWVSTREASTNQIAVCKQKYFLNCLILCRLGMETKGI